MSAVDRFYELLKEQRRTHLDMLHCEYPTLGSAWRRVEAAQAELKEAKDQYNVLKKLLGVDDK